MPTTVKVINNEVEHALRALKRQLLKEGIFKEIRRRASYEKPSERKKRKFSEAVKRQRKSQGKFV